MTDSTRTAITCMKGTFPSRPDHLVAIIDDECICCDACVETLVWAAAFIDATTSLVTHAIGADSGRSDHA